MQEVIIWGYSHHAAHIFNVSYSTRDEFKVVAFIDDKKQATTNRHQSDQARELYPEGIPIITYSEETCQSLHPKEVMFASQGRFREIHQLAQLFYHQGVDFKLPEVSRISLAKKSSPCQIAITGKDWPSNLQNNIEQVLKSKNIAFQNISPDFTDYTIQDSETSALLWTSQISVIPHIRCCPWIHYIENPVDWKFSYPDYICVELADIIILETKNDDVVKEIQQVNTNVVVSEVAEIAEILPTFLE